VEAKNQGESMVHMTEKNLSEHGDKVGDDVKTQVADDIAALKTALEGEDLEAITAATQALVQSSMKIGEAMYAESQEAEAAADAAAAGAADAADDVVDADFEEVDGEDDDDKKTDDA